MTNEFNALIKAIKFGNRDEKFDALGKIKKANIENIDEACEVILDAIAKGDGNLQLTGAVTLAALGNESDGVIEILTSVLSLPYSDSEIPIRYYAMEGLSYIRNRPEIIDTILNTAQNDDSIAVRNGAAYALGAIGNPKAKEYLEYQDQHGNSAAKAALALFGAEDFNTINRLDGVVHKARRCSVCNNVAEMKTTLLGKNKCPNCGSVGKYPLV